MSASIEAGSGAGFGALDEGVELGLPVVGALVTGGVVVLPLAYAVGPGPVVPPPRWSVGPAAVQPPSRAPAVRPTTRARGVRTPRVSPGTAAIPSPLPVFVPDPRPRRPTDDRWSSRPSDTPRDMPGTGGTAYQGSSVGSGESGGGLEDGPGLQLRRQLERQPRCRPAGRQREDRGVPAPRDGQARATAPQRVGRVADEPAGDGAHVVVQPGPGRRRQREVAHEDAGEE